MSEDAYRVTDAEFDAAAEQVAEFVAALPEKQTAGETYAAGVLQGALIVERYLREHAPTDE